MDSNDANVLINICYVFKTFKFNCSFNCFVMKNFWEQLSKRMRFSIFIEFDIFSAEEIKARAVCEWLFMDERSITRVLELELPVKSILIHEYQHKSTRVNTNQHESTRVWHESTRVRHKSTQINTSLTRVNTSQHESDTSQHESTRA